MVGFRKLHKVHIAGRFAVMLLAVMVVFNINILVIAGGDSNSRHHIPWEFTTYTEPDFRSDAIATFAPQYVRIIHSNDYGWGKIHTMHGEHWVYLRSNLRFINRAMGIFSYINDDELVSVIRPQVVNVLYRDGDWLQISTWLGPKWINLNFKPPVTQLENFMRRFESSMAIYYENLETGFVFTHNADRAFFSASVPKASLALYIFEKAEREEVDLDSTITFLQHDFWGGSGVIQHRYSVGSQITQRELLRLNLSESDNIATLMLRRYHGIAGYRQFISDIGGNPAFIGNRIFDSRLTANEAGLFAREIHRYIESGGKYSDEFKDHLLDNQFPFIVSDHPVASKTGWTRGHAWHDMAIVQSPSPYILVILTQRDGWTAKDYRDFEEISMAFQEFNNMWFESLTPLVQE
ncbi:MAG: class A beta-lactamase-related serine hydrolase [Defluviitaleaceae bacterium]|nr:class A beta-lactamase-related serine hydrolase [Defluviitaleaceae bacterium]